jgi:pimeloyl-ACP methyl ester carboxylesterase
MPSFGSRGFEIAYEEHGGGAGLPLVLVSGLGGSSQGWQVVTVPDLARARRCVTFDLRGAGRSEDPGGPFTTRDLAADALALLDHLGLERAHVLGAFLGGLVAQELALAAQERVASLVLVGAYARLDAKRRMLLETWKELAHYQLPPELRVRIRLLWTLHEDTLEQHDLVDQMVRFFVRDGAPVEEKLFARQVDACLAHQALPRLGQLDVPTLVVAGEDDRLTTPRLTRELANAIPGARMVLMPGVGHLAMAEAAPRFNRLVERFLAEHDSAP